MGLSSVAPSTEAGLAATAWLGWKVGSYLSLATFFLKISVTSGKRPFWGGVWKVLLGAWQALGSRVRPFYNLWGR